MISGCVEWHGARNKSGHGLLRGLYKNMLVHRAAWLVEKGKEPEGCLLHRCDVPNCINTDHLFIGTRADNLADMRRKDRQRDYSDCVGMKGEDNPNTILTESKVLEIRAAIGTQSSIAAKYGISREHVRDIKLRKRWKHLNG